MIDVIQDKNENNNKSLKIKKAYRVKSKRRSRLEKDKSSSSSSSSSSDDSVALNRETIHKLRKDAIHSKMKIHSSRVKRIGIRYGDLNQRDIMLSFIQKHDKKMMKKIIKSFKL